MRELEQAAEESIRSAEESLRAIAQEVEEANNSTIQSDNEAFYAAAEEVLSANTDSKFIIHLSLTKLITLFKQTKPSNVALNRWPENSNVP